MVSLIGWIMTTGSCENSVSTTVDEPGFVETTCVDSGICEDDVAPEILIVLVLVERCLLRRPEVAFGGKDGFSVVLCERWEKGCYYSTLTNLFYDQNK